MKKKKYRDLTTMGKEEVYLLWNSSGQRVDSSIENFSQGL
jgi:hypothetical protein